MKNIVVLVSGGGTNLQALIEAEGRGAIPGGTISCVISSNPGAFALERAKKYSIRSRVLDRTKFSSGKEYGAAMVSALKEEKADLIVLAGFMVILDSSVVNAFPNQIINVHPSLIPSFCGEGFYGLRVHEAALERGVKTTGATVHFVSEITDGGPIILQGTVSVLEDDTPQSLQRRVMEQVEWKLLPRAAALFCAEQLRVENGKVFILPKGEIESNGLSLL